MERRNNNSGGGGGGGYNRGGRDGGNNRGGGGFSNGPREMHKTTCSKCKKECEVPFKPTQGKPVYCKECFSKMDR